MTILKQTLNESTFHFRWSLIFVEVAALPLLGGHNLFSFIIYVENGSSLWLSFVELIGAEH